MPNAQHGTLRKVPSLIIHGTSGRPSATKIKASKSTPIGVSARRTEEVVPDSEEERILSRSKSSETSSGNEVIEISSDEEDEAHNDKNDNDFFTMPGSWSASRSNSQTSPGSSSGGAGAPAQKSPMKSPRISTKYPPSRRVIESSDSEEADEPRVATKPKVNEVIELTDDESSSEKASPSKPLNKKPNPASKATSSKLPLYADDSDDETSDPAPRSPQHDPAVLTLNEPRSHRKTFPLSKQKNPDSAAASTPRRTKGQVSTVVDVVLDVQVTPLSGRSTSPSKRRTGKKAEEAAKLQRLQDYAANLFDELNEQIFDKKIPTSTTLEWNKRMTTTAGKASYHRSTTGVVTSKIELATKVLDAEDRIDRTLSHEMCHLATWIISGKLREQHGQYFKAWADRVHSRRPDIEVSTTHNYEINFTHRWQCQHCQLIYGRFSNSIDTKTQGCGTCKQGLLVPLFETGNKRNSATPNEKVSRMAASKPRDSPAPISRPPLSTNSPSLSRSGSGDMEIFCVHDSGSEPESELNEGDRDTVEIEALAATLGSTSLSA